MTFKRICVAVVGIAAMAMCAGIRAQQPQPINFETPPSQKATAKADQKKIETVTGRADVLKTLWGDKTQVMMKGNVKFTSSDTVLTSNEVNYDKQTKIAVSPGKLSITNPDCDLDGDKGSADFSKKLAIVEGNVKMLAKPKNADEPADKDSVKAKLNKPTIINCGRLEYLFKQKLATATGGVTFKQDKRSGSAHSAVYDAKKELLTLTGDVKGTDEDGQTFSAPKVVISLKKGDEWMEAENANASFKIDTEEQIR